ncbi:MAG: aminoglycoside phosphotransferase family protein [Proteobacteria bacterium]|nr:aminoglycoside phosphotransferase family protein [Pseudomonadota bacterium]
MIYQGHLPKNDPLYHYLRYDILPQVGVNGSTPDFRVYRIPASNHVYFYEDHRSQASFIGKFYNGVKGRSPESARLRMEREFNNLNYLRSINFAGYPHYVARPLGVNASLDCVLIEEFCYGTPLTHFILGAIRDGAREALFQKLTALAWFLASMHNRTANGNKVDFNRDCVYFDRLMEQLKSDGHLGWGEAEEYYRLKDHWHEKGYMWEDQQVLVHGDVTPANILFGDGPWVIAIDLERMKTADRVFDVGRLAGEIKHFFIQYTGDKWLAEPFIRHFLWEYSCHFPDRHRAFDAITRRIPFHMGLTLLRIARNSWISPSHRQQLLIEAKRTLR